MCCVCVSHDNLDIFGSKSVLSANTDILSACAVVISKKIEMDAMFVNYRCEYLPVRYISKKKHSVLCKYANKIIKSNSISGAIYNPFTGKHVHTDSVAALALRLFANITHFEDDFEMSIYQAICVSLPETYYDCRVEYLLSKRYEWRRRYFDLDNIVFHPFTLKTLLKNSDEANTWNRVFDTTSWYLRTSAYGNGCTYHTILFSKQRLRQWNVSNLFTPPTNIDALLDSWVLTPECSNYDREGAYHDVSPVFSNNKYHFDTNHSGTNVHRSFSVELLKYMRSSEFKNRVLNNPSTNRDIRKLHVSTKQCHQRGKGSEFLSAIFHAACAAYGGPSFRQASLEVYYTILDVFKSDGKVFEGADACVICHGDVTGASGLVTYLPCRHKITCLNCLDSWKTCPLCRRPIIIAVVDSTSS